MTQSGIEPATFRFAAQHLTHCATASEGFYVNEKNPLTPAGIEPAIFSFVAQRLNPLNTELDPICHLLALLRAHHILHVSRPRVKRRIKSHLTFAGIIRSSPYSPR